MAWFSAVTDFFGGDDDDDDKSAFLSERMSRISESVVSEEASDNDVNTINSDSIPLPEGPVPDSAYFLGVPEKLSSEYASSKKSNSVHQFFSERVPPIVTQPNFSPYNAQLLTFAAQRTPPLMTQPEITITQPVLSVTIAPEVSERKNIYYGDEHIGGEEAGLDLLSDISDYETAPKSTKVFEELRATERHLSLIASRLRVDDSDAEDELNAFPSDMVANIQARTSRKLILDVMTKGADSFSSRPPYAKYLTGRTRQGIINEDDAGKDDKKTIVIDKIPLRIESVMKVCRWDGAEENSSKKPGHDSHSHQHDHHHH